MKICKGTFKIPSLSVSKSITISDIGFEPKGVICGLARGRCNTQTAFFQYDFETGEEILNIMDAADSTWSGELKISRDGDSITVSVWVGFVDASYNDIRYYSYVIWG